MSRSWEEQWAILRPAALELPSEGLSNLEASDWFTQKRKGVLERIGGYYIAQTLHHGEQESMERRLADLVALVVEQEALTKEWFDVRKEQQKLANIAKDAARQAEDRARRHDTAALKAERRLENETNRKRKLEAQREKARTKPPKVAKPKAVPVVEAVVAPPSPDPEKEILTRVFRTRPSVELPPKFESFDGYCPISGKQRWPTKKQAKTVANDMNEGDHRKRGKSVVHAYPCSECHSWHVGRDKSLSPDE